MSWLEFELEFKKLCIPYPRNIWGEAVSKEAAYVNHLDRHNRVILRQLIGNNLDPRVIDKTEENFTKVRQFVHDAWKE